MATEGENLLDLSDAPYALQTYYNYVTAWVSHCFQSCENANSLEGIIENFHKLPSSKKMQGGRALTDSISLNYWRGKLTLRAMKNFPISDHKVLAPTANLWLPVQAYYAIHGVGISCITSLGQSAPTSHKAFRASFSNLCRQYLPAPFNALCCKGPDKTKFIFKNLNTTPEKVLRLSNLSNPRYGDIEEAIGKCLSSTRSKLLDDKFREARKQNVKPGCRTRRLKNEEKQTICNNLHSTSVVDFLYRMRVRSNYEEPDMFLLNADENESAEHYNRLVFLTEALACLLEQIICKKIGKTNFDKLSNVLSG